MIQSYPQAKSELSIVQAGLPVDEVQCVFVDWYRFKRCEVTTCKNWTSRTEHACLGVDRVQPTGNKIISDSELHYFKFYDSGISTKYVSIKRKETTQRVKAILTLHSFLRFISTRYGERPKQSFLNPRIQTLEKKYPFKVKRLGYENWMLPYLVSKKAFKAFLHGKEGEVMELSLSEVLGIPPTRLVKLTQIIKEIKDGTSTNPSSTV